MTPSSISTGAVIITGETARKSNANEVLNALSGMAGDFIEKNCEQKKSKVSPSIILKLSLTFKR